eukprot:GHVP01019893.1.p1 GENE.GHVP01019893.1~~GHVP01019893.1.p1  ORF type:complete len:622 (-),score=106.72 GHVP01019893.1:1537-3402(-)
MKQQRKDLYIILLFISSFVFCSNSGQELKQRGSKNVKNSQVKTSNLLSKVEDKVNEALCTIRREIDDIKDIEVFIDENYPCFGETNLPFLTGSECKNACIFLEYEERLGILRSMYTACWLRKIEMLYEEESNKLVSHNPDITNEIKKHIEASLKEARNKFDIIYENTKEEIRTRQIAHLNGDAEKYTKPAPIETDLITAWIGILNKRTDNIRAGYNSNMFEIEDLEDKLGKKITSTEIEDLKKRKMESEKQLNKKILETYPVYRETLIDATKTRKLLKERIDSTIRNSPERKNILQDVLEYPGTISNLPVSTIIKNKNKNYKITGSLGSGSDGNVYKCTELSTNQEVAIKACPYKRSSPLKEARIIQGFQYNHPESKDLVITLFRTFVYKDLFCMVFEVFDTDLRIVNMLPEKKGGLDITKIKKILEFIFRCLEVFKKGNILHEDVRLKNILVRKPSFDLKLADFGRSSYYDPNNRKADNLQDNVYKAPEVWTIVERDFAVDMWSVGCIIYELITKQKMFSGDNYEELLHVLNSVINWDDMNGNINKLTEFMNNKTGDLNNKTGGISKMTEKPLFLFKGSDGIRIEPKYIELYGLMVKILKINPKERPSPTEALKELEKLK